MLPGKKLLQSGKSSAGGAVLRQTKKRESGKLVRAGEIQYNSKGYIK